MRISDISIDRGTQHRAVNPDVVSLYVERMKAGDVFPPVEVYLVGDTHLLTDGFHRLSASIRCGKEEIEADVKVGTLRDAIFASYGANKTNGYQRTNVRSLIEDFYNDARTGAWSLTQASIADIIGCSTSYVAQVAKELAGENYQDKEPDTEPEVDIQDSKPTQCPLVEITDVESPEQNYNNWSAYANRLIGLCQNISGDIKQIESLSGVGYEYLANHRASDISTMRHLVRNLMSYAPVRGCPQCAGKHKECSLCGGNGYITTLQEKNLPAGLLEALE